MINQPLNAKEKELLLRYRELVHAVQSGIAASKDKTDWEPKHLRVGVNMSKVDHAALVNLLIAKGIFTREEYFEELVKMAENEVDMYRAEIARQHGVDPDKIHLA